MNKEIIVSMPLFIVTGTKKRVKRYLNLNQYRNWHYQVNNHIKQEYKKIVALDIYGLKFNNKIKLEFVLWKRDRRLLDRSNYLSIHEKFFCDALVEMGCIKDDNDDFIESTYYRTGGIDKSNPRVDIHIIELNK